jgi:hypothetical protein
MMTIFGLTAAAEAAPKTPLAKRASSAGQSGIILFILCFVESFMRSRICQKRTVAGASEGRISLFVRLLIDLEAAGGRFGAWAAMKNTHI